MSKSTEQCLELICNQHQMSTEVQNLYNKDAEKIRNNLVEKMKENCPFFKANFVGLSFTGSYFDHLKLDLPDDFQIHLKIKLPFKVTPRANKQRPGFIDLICDRKRNHPTVGTKDKISRYNLQMWIHSILLATIGEGLHFGIDERIYKIDYPKYGRGWGVAHTVIATETGENKFQISFDFIPVFEFGKDEWPFKKSNNEKIQILKDNQVWFAVPHGQIHGDRKEKSNSYVFMVCTPNCEDTALHNNKNLKNGLRLMRLIRNAQNLEKLTDYMLKSLYLKNVDGHSKEILQKPIIDILIVLLETLSEDLNKNRLPYFLHKGVENLDLCPKKLSIEYYVKVERILRKLKNSKEQNFVHFDEILMIFTKQKQTKSSNLKSN